MAAVTVGDKERMDHVEEKHGLSAHACPKDCDPDFPRAGCKACGGWGMVFTMDTKPCGPGCPVGNPQ